MKANLLAALLTGLVACLSRMPRRLIPAVAAGLAWLARPFLGRELRQLRTNIHRIYGLPPGTHFAAQFERQVLRHQLECAFETLRAIHDPALVTVSGLDELKAHIAQAEAAGKGHILVTAHIGSWELCAYYGQQAATRPFHVLAKPARQPGVTRVLNALRERMGTHVLWTDRKTLLRDMLGALRKGESVGFVMDQKPEGRKGPVVPFLGQPTEFVSGPASMAIKTGCAVISIFCLREGPFRFRLLSRTLAPANHGEQDELSLTARMAAEIDTVVRIYPEQWTWNYKRWRFSSATTRTAMPAPVIETRH